MRRLTALAAALVLSAGCSSFIDTAMNSAGRTSGDIVGNAVGKRVGDALVRSYSPMFLQWYTSYMLGLAFGAGGYTVGEADYQPGEWTRWQVAGDDKSWMERAYLFAEDDGSQWWKVKYFDGESGDTMILEALLAPDRSEIKRMRARFPNDEEAKEMPVQENSYYVPPVKLTEESIEGATVENGKVAVPAGTFDARHIRYGSGSGGSYDWWMVEGIPGGLAKYGQTAPGGADEAPEGAEDLDPDNYTLILAAYGQDAKSELGITKK